MSAAQERRRFHRFPFEAEGHLMVPTLGSVNCDLIDLSISGALLLLQRPVDQVAGRSGHLDLILRGLVRGDKVEIHSKVEAIWQENLQLGCRFVGVDADSFAHLKTLIEDNLGDPSLLDRELTQLAYWPGVERSSTA
jgi:hypothetical protein